MYNYTALSRKGLVQMANDFDETNEGALSTFVTEKEMNGESYPLIKPAEFIFSNFEDKKQSLVDHMKGKLDDASETIDRVVNAIFEGGDEIGADLLNEVTKEVFRNT